MPTTKITGLMPVVEAEARSHGIRVSIQLHRDLPDLNADAPVLEQALLNLALNACEATLSGGSLRIAAEFSDVGQSRTLAWARCRHGRRVG